MLAHSINRGVSKHALPRVLLPSILSRSVSNWGRRGWPRWRDEADEEWKRVQLKMMEAFDKQLKADPYEAIFGRSNEILRGIPPTPPAGSLPRKTVPISTESETNAQDTAQPSPTADPQPTVEFSYDPITGRMTPKYGASDSPAVEDLSVHYSQSHHDPRDDSLSAYDRKQSSTPTQPSDWLVREELTQTTSNTAEQDQLREDSYKKTPRRPNLPEDDVDLLTAADVRARMGICKDPNRETVEQMLEKSAQLQRDFRLIQAQDPSSYIYKTLSRIQEARAIFEKRRHLADEYAAAEKAEKLSEQQSTDILETALSCTARKSLDDGYSQVPTGLQTSFEREKASGRDLATDIETRTKPVQYDDGYSRTPMGLQTSFEMEQAAGRSLAEDIQAKTEPRNYIVDDGYSREPMGLETSFEREKALGHSLAEEIDAKTNPKQYIVDDGYSREPTGLQTSYEREIEAFQNGQRKSLEEELQEQALGAAHGTSEFDGQGFSRKPIGLETSFQRELDACASGKRKSLEEELAVPVDGGAVETMSTKEEAAKLEAAREQRLHDIALVRERKIHLYLKLLVFRAQMV
ncbi:hypothetical protein UCDDS831_g05522 [Diplodia seriata]|uniref:Uncharacterized protein n=1 Tax=Diplodia seriata TaxID=420778 RepID=A0A0G2E8J6_9PEZI|nr:hypothetical protein UCDDS831_g05522 [Diplodia seriata]